ncbi:BLUF domain-containing protein [Sphingomicrobium nitratireducens]|uniref:BLUF domain-containing protein n=1 Tax=Sphingomicrobium nitratireducens TaxID=2964666 RepID=UPI00223F99F5|nr:BLUF domain-containing protein [Sphingomicrobium nitratireducens]
MLQLLYISTARVPMDDAALTVLLGEARINNRRDEVTGLLIAAGRRFLQMLEGEAVDVERVFARIQRDPRHHALVLLSRREVEERSFGDWDMAFARAPGGIDLGGANAQLLPEAVAAALEGVDDRMLRAEMEGFARLHAA